MDNYIITKSGRKVYINYKDNICCGDKENRALIEKAKLKRERYSKGEAGKLKLSRFGSVASEDALTWSVFRTLELKNKMGIFYNLVDMNDILERTIFWARDTQTEKEDCVLKEILNEVEPETLWKQQTEPDVILVGKRTVIFNESKLGEPNNKILGWKRKEEFKDRHYRYKNYLDNIFTDEFKEDFEQLGREFYQLMRNIIIGTLYAEKVDKEFHLSVIVNQLNTAENGISHRDNFEEFSNYLTDKTKIHFTTWQDIIEAIAKEVALSDLNNYLKFHSCLKEENK